MEVTVVKLRTEGEKLSPAQVEQATPQRGYPRLSYWQLQNQYERRRVKTLSLLGANAEGAPPLLSLTDVELLQPRGDNLVISGTERVGGVPYLQSWWIRLHPRTDSYATSGRRAE